MYHFTFIDEASTIVEQDQANSQENASKKLTRPSKENKTILTRPARFLKEHFIHRALFSIFISDH